MFFKISFKNVAKSFKDYMLYFFTLTFGVCVFYIFNSIEAQTAMIAISSSTKELMKTLTNVIGAVSVFVSFILGFLILYANNFLIKRRKKEFGIYLTLGMDKIKVAKILISETLIIGTLSLATGLIAGIFLSQFLSVITAKLFEVNMSQFIFVFSSQAFVKAIVYFSIIFIVAMFMSTVAISKYKLIALLNASKQNEKPKLKSTKLSFVLFVISIAFLCTAYIMVLKNGIEKFDIILISEMILGAIGTFLFFASLSGFFLKLIQANKKRYLKGLNMFILRQVNSRINTAHISISFICLMLFCTIGILSTGLGMNAAMDRGLTAPYDVTLQSSDGTFVSERIKQDGLDVYKYTDNVLEFNTYENAEIRNELILSKVDENLPEFAHNLFSQKLDLIKLSEYNKIVTNQGKQKLKLDDNQVAIFSNISVYVEDLRKALDKFIDSKYSIFINNNSYNVYSNVLTDNLYTSHSDGILIGLVVPDEMIGDAKLSMSTLSFNCIGDSKDMQNKFADDTSKLYSERFDPDDVFFVTKNLLKEASIGIKVIISFLGIYMGLIFLITSAAILALQQLSEAADNKQRYSILKKIGADDKLINKAILKQTSIYFILPLALASVHSIVGLTVANRAVSQIGNLNAAFNIIITAILILFVYGAYFIGTYFGSKNIILK